MVAGRLIEPSRPDGWVHFSLIAIRLKRSTGRKLLLNRRTEHSSNVGPTDIPREVFLLGDDHFDLPYLTEVTHYRAKLDIRSERGLHTRN